MILVTGGTGLVGSSVARALVAQGASVRILCRPSSRVDRLGSIIPGVELVRGDLTEARDVRRAAAGTRAIIHCAALTEVSVGAEAVERTNHLGTRHVVDAALEAGVERLIHVSSSVTVGGPGDGEIYDEDSPSRWRLLASVYHDSKAAAEREVATAAARGLTAVTVNPVQIVDSSDHEDRRSMRLVRGVASHGGWLYPTGGISVTRLDRVTEAIVAALTRGSSGRRYLLSGPNVTYRQFLSAVARRCGTRAPVVPVGRTAARALALASLAAGVVARHPVGMSLGAARGFGRRAWYTCRRAVEELGYRPPTLDEVLDALLRP